MSGVIKTAIVGAVTAVFVASVAIAGGQGPGQGQGPGMRGFGPGFGGPGGPGGRGPLMGIMKDLSEQQRDQVRAIMQEQREQGPPAGAQLRRQLEAEVLAETPNDQKIEELRQQIVIVTGEQLTRHITTHKRIARILTPEQRAKARERLEQAPQQRPQGPRGRGARR